MADAKLDVSQFGKDHWSTLAYCAAMFYSEKGIGKQQMRCNPERHPHFAHSGGWSDKYSTRLRDGGQAIGHDDWDCLWDLENYGFIGVLTGRAEIFWLTAKGNRAARELIEHKRAGGNFATFTPSQVSIYVAGNSPPAADEDICPRSESDSMVTERFTRVVK